MSAKADVTGETLSFEFGGESYAVVPSAEWDLDVLENFEEGRIVAVLRSVLADDGWARLKAKGAKVSDLEPFMAALAKAVGAGN